jgi:prepilin-type N-terminal cleavage/methylation domain-containing protein
MRWTAGGFSLAELMIALAILGMGLLVIGAALPAGARYTRESVDIASGEAAAEYALDIIEQNICIHDDILDDTDTLIRAPAIFVPRLPTSDPAEGAFVSTHEPLIKVRPLYTQNVNAMPGNWRGMRLFDPGGVATVYDATNIPEAIIAAWLGNYGGGFSESTGPKEVDQVAAGVSWTRPPISALETVFPAVEAEPWPAVGDTRYNPTDFLNPLNAQYRYGWRIAAQPGEGNEIEKALKRRVCWTAFYRRVSYQPGSDPTLYEVIAVACRVSEGQRFPIQDWTQSGGMWDGTFTKTLSATAGKSAIADAEAMTPIPSLVAFSNNGTGGLRFPELTEGWDYQTIGTYPGPYKRVLRDTFVEPDTLVFPAKREVGLLMPPGSIFVPARNDYMPTLFTGGPISALVPSAPDALPIFEVVDRVQNADGSFQIIVRYDGYYPWLGGGEGADQWPVWVIPPAFEERDTVTGEPLYSDRSPVVAVARRYIRVPLVE